jgi:hypothetical protein
MRLRSSRQNYYVNKFPYGSLKYVSGDIKTAKEFLMRRVYVLLVVGILLFGACSAQSANAQNANNAQRIIGTWTDHFGGTWVFGTDGKVTISGSIYYYGVADTKLALCDSDYGNSDAYLSTYTISISSDGKTLILGDGVGRLKSTYWLKK